MTAVEEVLGTAGRWRLDARRSSITLTCRSLWGLLPVRGRFETIAGHGEITNSGTAFGELTITAASLKTGIGRRDQHLASADFFDVDRYPTITAAVQVSAPTGRDTVDLHLELTVKSTTRGLELPARVAALDDGTIRLTTEATVDRHDYGVDGNMLGMIAADAVVSADVVFTPG